MKAGNNFNLIRLVLALSVCFYHFHALTGLTQFSMFSEWFNAEEAVNAFFILSGYLIYNSFERRPSLRDYGIRRLLRIYPAYMGVILFAAFGLCFFSQYSPKEYFLNAQWWRYMGFNLVFLNFMQPNLPGVFEDHILSAVNGSLWSLKIEVGFYLILPFLFFWLQKGSFWVRFGMVLLASVVYRFGLQYGSEATGQASLLFLSRQVPGQFFYFLLGISITKFQSLPPYRVVLRVVGIVSLILLIFFSVSIWIKPLLVTAALFFLATGIPVLSGPWQRNDISYGVYIYHFPLIQIGIDLGWFQFSPWMSFGLILVLCVLCGILSWRYIEKPLLQRDFGKFQQKILYR
jgi:peptidoglycan/LPS O-acetylase OafA/YrhL